MAQREKWQGGEVHRDASGRSVYWIRRKLGGRAWDFSLRTGDIEAALAEYRRWRQDPFAYRLVPQPLLPATVGLMTSRLSRIRVQLTAMGPNTTRIEISAMEMGP